MTTLPLHASDLPRLSVGFGRVRTFITTMMEVFAEAREHALAVERRLSRPGW